MLQPTNKSDRMVFFRLGYRGIVHSLPGGKSERMCHLVAMTMRSSCSKRLRNSESLFSDHFRDASTQHRPQLAPFSYSCIRQQHLSACLSAQLHPSSCQMSPWCASNVPGGINVHGLMGCLLKHFQFGPEYTVLSKYGGDASSLFFTVQGNCPRRRLW